jgi:putative transcriptional regulator
MAKRIRWGLRMSQVEFAKTFHIPLGTLRDWEQHRRDPDQAAQAYLEVIAREPDTVRRALKARATKAA